VAYILALGNRRDVLGDADNEPLFRTATTVAVAVISLVSNLLVGQTLIGWLVH
jgi:hypothetical protein